MRLPPCQKCRLKRWASDGIFYFKPLQVEFFDDFQVVI